MKNKDQLLCKVLMLATDKNTRLYTAPDQKLYMSKDEPLLQGVGTSCKHYHLYLTSSREIKEGDWFLNTRNNQVLKASENLGSVGYTNADNSAFLHIQDWHKKIEATTDSSLGLPQIHQSFIEAYLKAEGKIDEVSIQTTLICNEHIPAYNQECCGNGGCGTATIEVKTREDNTVIIHQTRMYSKDDIIMILNQFYSNLTDDSTYDGTVLDQWIEENL